MSKKKERHVAEESKYWLLWVATSKTIKGNFGKIEKTGKNKWKIKMASNGVIVQRQAFHAVHWLKISLFRFAC